ncbi:MAG TPA: hypothetical protein VH933_17445 [Aestuariivirgaceae bacterium]
MQNASPSGSTASIRIPVFLAEQLQQLHVVSHLEQGSLEIRKESLSLLSRVPVAFQLPYTLLLFFHARFAVSDQSDCPVPIGI